MSVRPHRDPLGTCKMPDECYAQIFFDGARIYAMSLATLPPRLETYQLNSLEAVEYYEASNVPSQYGGSAAACGTLLLWSRRKA